MKKGFNDAERVCTKERICKKLFFADGNVGARVRLMVRGGCLPVKGSERMTWKYGDDFFFFIIMAQHIFKRLYQLTISSH